MLPEALRGAGSLAPAVGASFNLVGGQVTQGELVAPEDVGGSIDLYLRLRALCNTLSLVSVTSPTWLPYFVGESFCDQVLEWLNTKYDGKRLPFSFYLQAYVSTFGFFTDAVRTNDTPLADLMANTSAYRSFWVNFSPPSAVPVMAPPPGAPPAKSGHSGQPDPAPDVGREMARMRDMNARLQARAELVSRDNNTNNRAPLARRGGAGSSGGGGGGGFRDRFRGGGHNRGKARSGGGERAGGGDRKRKRGNGGGGGGKHRK